MEQKKNNINVLTIILVVLLLVAVGIICYLLGSNNVNKNNQNNSVNVSEEKENNQGSANNVNVEGENTLTPVSYSPKCSDSQIQQQNLLVDIDETKYNSISEYIQAQKNVRITLNYCNDNPDTDDIEIYGYELTDSEKNIVFSELKNSTYNIVLSELGGVCVDSVKITYERNNNQYYVSYYQLFAMKSDDGNIYKILDKSVNNILSEEENKYCGYHFDNLSTTLNSMIIKLKSN